ncbi:hypothetical protein Daus18300_010146 [Diaporthe australafricana]|uniref:AAA+ ATPase domain-containing protein n=1 Tax=Diaporthe australafricana TaxID=127596 RepID=A0ABR3WBE5_9PEZI
MQVSRSRCSSEASSYGPLKPEPLAEPGAPHDTTPTHSPIGNSTRIMTGTEAMNSADELRLYLVDICSPFCPKTCPSCKPRWSDLTAETEQARIAALENANGIINRISPKAGDKTVQIDVQSTHMKNVLTSVFDGYPGFYPSLMSKDSAWIFRDPFSIFVGRWSQLLEYGERATVLDTYQAWVTLIDTLTPVVQPTLDAIERIRDTGLISWDDLSLIFPPGKLIIVEQPGAVRSVVRVKEGTNVGDGALGTRAHVLKYEYIDWDGETCGLRTSALNILLYAGHKRVGMTELGTMPLEFCPNLEELATELIARGRRWASLMGIGYKQFGGKKVPLKTQVPIEASGRIVIDATAFYDQNPHCRWLQKPSLRSLAAESEDPEAEERTQPVDLSEVQYLLASGVVSSPSTVSVTLPSTLAYNNLVLPPSEKKMAWAFVESKTLLGASSDSNGNTAFDDFVADKGKGLVMLLCGPPGVGKTYTAEAIAEMAKVPLYMMSAGELGSAPANVEKELDKALDLCRRWKAMLLLDEADVFLGKRFSGGDASIERNELVSIFLRRLEYYQGTMFLTTNRIQNINDAFQSRIDIILPYGDLTAEARLQVWANFIEKSGGEGKFDLTGLQIQHLAREYNLNGREIKNLVKSSLLIAGKFDDRDVSIPPGPWGKETENETEAAKDPIQVKVSMDMLETLAAMRIRAHRLMGTTKADGSVGY